MGAARCEPARRWVFLKTRAGGAVATDGSEFALVPLANGGSDSVDRITDDVMQIISRELKIPIERVTPDTALQDLGVESLDLIEIIFALEEKFDINIPTTRTRCRPSAWRRPRGWAWGIFEPLPRSPRP
jgi:acyl carrier protein